MFFGACFIPASSCNYFCSSISSFFFTFNSSFSEVNLFLSLILQVGNSSRSTLLRSYPRVAWLALVSLSLFRVFFWFGRNYLEPSDGRPRYVYDLSKPFGSCFSGTPLRFIPVVGLIRCRRRVVDPLESYWALIFLLCFSDNSHYRSLSDF